MNEKQSLKARCRICGGEYTSRGMSRHVSTCLTKSTEKEKASGKGKIKPFYHVLVRDAYGGYWLHLKVAGNTVLSHLDQFLREIWLECCGHMSAFFPWREIETELSMDMPIQRVFAQNLTLEYWYDFGSTTALSVQIMGKYQGIVSSEEPVEVLARNPMPACFCDCGQPARFICAECQYNDPEAYFCESCGKDHECGEEMLLPLVNSPRCGVCAYCGESDRWA